MELTNQQLQVRLQEATKSNKSKKGNGAPEDMALVRALRSDKEALERKISELTHEWSNREAVIVTLQAKIQDLNNSVEAAQSRAKAEQARANSLQTDLNAMVTEKVALETELKESWARATEEIHEDAQRMRNALNASQTTSQLLAGTVRSLQEDKTELDQRAQLLTLKYERLLSEHKDALQHTSQLQTTISTLASEKEQLLQARLNQDSGVLKLKDKIESLASQLKTSQAAAEQAKTELAEVHQLCETHKSAVIAKEEEVNQLKDHIQTLQSKLDEIDAEQWPIKYADLKRENENLKVLTHTSSDLGDETLKKRIEEVERQLKSALSDVREGQSKMQQLQKTLDAARSAEAKATSKVTQLETECDELKKSLTDLNSQPAEGNSDVLKKEIAKAKLQQQTLNSQVYWLKQSLERVTNELAAEREKHKAS
eukprot:c5997_g1_i2.p1 GENE.c5997_g1_i2~~c5997_g1_i2.p1  ORF type:complete len:428 (+),score=114.81 c5997_g1_i2:191-1474(+)